MTVLSNAAIAGGAVTAAAVRIRKPAAEGGAITVAGIVSGYLPATGSFNVDGLAVSSTGAELKPRGATISNDAYVIVTGRYETGSTVLRADTIAVRNTDNVEHVSLTGTISNFVSSANFMVRGVLTDASSASFTGGTSADLANNKLVEVAGVIASGKVVASTVRFRNLAAAGTWVADLGGIVTAFNPTTRVLGLALFDGSLSTTLPSDVRILPAGKTVADLTAGVRVKMHGVFAAGAFTAQELVILGAEPAGTVHDAEGIVATVSPASGRPTSFTMNGITFAVGGGVALPAGFGVGMRVHVVFTDSGATHNAQTIVVDNDAR